MQSSDHESESNDARHDIDDLLKDWPYETSSLSVRKVLAHDGRTVLQMRIEMGILQLETSGRPDGGQPGGASSYLDYLLQLSDGQDDFELNEEQCSECDREFVQYYHRRICWLGLQEYAEAVKDADHTLALMDFCSSHSPDPNWTLSHEQYRAFVMYHRIQAHALAVLDEGGPENAIMAINQGLENMRGVYDELEAEEQFESDELVTRLVELRESLRSQFDVGRTLPEQLEDAISREQYELAAKLRDELANRQAEM